jgi:catechol 2,3-dioxygenase-like lactoylglutathione lyase family enzyme
MNQSLAHVSLLVSDYEEAIEFYTQKLKFILVENTKLSDEKSWVLVRPQGDASASLLLAKAVGDQKQFIGNQSGGRVFLFLETDNFERDYQNLLKQKVTIVRPPTDELYGRVCVFADLYGNKWDLIERRTSVASAR